MITGCKNARFENCTFSENSADYYGGGMVILDSIETVLDNCNFTLNSASIGGGIYNFRCDSISTLTNCKFTKNSVIRIGGGLYNAWGSSPILTSCTFEENTAGAGGGVYNYLNSSPTFTDCIFTTNLGIQVGGGMHNTENCNPELTNCKFDRNVASHGAGLDNNLNCSPKLTYCTFTGNLATSGGGGGGGMSNWNNCNPALSDCTFSNNSAGSGGGIYNYTSGPTVSECVFEENNAVDDGGAIYNGTSDCQVTNCTFSMNSAEYGGAISNKDLNAYPISPTFVNCLFINNSAMYGGALSNKLDDPRVINCTFSQNSSSNGNAVWNNYPCQPIFTNCILWDGGNEIQDDGGSATAITYSNVQDGWSGTGNINEDPMFVGPTADLHLQPDSPCIDAGDSSAVPTWVTTDLDGNPRILGNAVDMGVYELSNVSPLAIITLPSSGFVEVVDVPIQFAGDIIDPDTVDTHTAIWTISNENWMEDLVIEGSVTDLSISDEIPFIEAGIYSIKLTVTDSHDESDETTIVNDDPESPAFVVVYDPDGGFVTGGGWIWSPAGAYADDPGLEGKANFGFVSKYKKGATTPTGQTEFVFKAGGFNFHSSSYDWLVVTGSNFARFKGIGTINGSGEYKFMLWAGDGPDTFRIRIWEEDESGIEHDVYDNGFDQDILGGNIIIHTSN